MKITHQYQNTKIIKETEGEAGLVLGNDLGNFFYMTGKKESRYQGFFHANSDNQRYELDVYKIIDKINILNTCSLAEIVNNFSSVLKKYEDGLCEEYFLPSGFNSLCLNTNHTVDSEIILDIRHPYDSRKMGRFYNIEIKNDLTIIRFEKKKDWEEDGIGDKKEFLLYLVIKSDSTNVENVEKFFSKYYEKDQDRNSAPWDRFVFHAVNMSFTKAVFSVAKSKKDAIAEAEYLYKNFTSITKKESTEINKKFKLPKITDKEIKMAYLCAINSISTLSIGNNEKKGAYAGLPWFFQFWHRDEAISLLQIYKINKKLGEEIIRSQINSILSDGQVPKKRYHKLQENELQSADALGWLANRIIKIDKKHKLPEDLKIDVIKGFEIAATNLIKERTKNELAVSFKNETWMDSLNREPHCLEIQACRYNIYDLLYQFTGNDQYEIIKDDLKTKIIEKFYQDDILNDCTADDTIRPNIFITAYLFPNLLDKESWEKCFDKILPRLYLDWGGLSSVDITSDKFISIDTGENSASYHNGTSWYWLNNLAALVLYKNNPHKYSNYINEIMDANTREILYKGIAGHHGEISSANKQTSTGCEAQLWSSALYLEVFDEILSN
ncbi:hypothetical protein K0B03_00970 [Patescibacteria group bacterium]|nr:hypothetical protein [Patescibacteria group bacterium]